MIDQPLQILAEKNCWSTKIRSREFFFRFLFLCQSRRRRRRRRRAQPTLDRPTKEVPTFLATSIILQFLFGTVMQAFVEATSL